MPRGDVGMTDAVRPYSGAGVLVVVGGVQPDLGAAGRKETGCLAVRDGIPLDHALLDVVTARVLVTLQNLERLRDRGVTWWQGRPPCDSTSRP